MARNTGACEEFLEIVALDFWDCHDCLGLLAVAKRAADHDRVGHVLKEMEAEALSPRENIMLVISFILLLREMSIRLLQMHSQMP